jgi:hypothetical protein
VNIWTLILKSLIHVFGYIPLINALISKISKKMPPNLLIDGISMGDAISCISMTRLSLSLSNGLLDCGPIGKL